MKIFEIIDEENHIDIGTLLYFERKKIFIIELMDNLDEWTAPLIFSNFVTRGIYTIQREFSKMWVNERIIPSGRQNIGSILKNHKLQSYDEMKFLELSNGRCSQVSMYIKKIEHLPGYVQKRKGFRLPPGCKGTDVGRNWCGFRLMDESPRNQIPQTE